MIEPRGILYAVDDIHPKMKAIWDAVLDVPPDMRRTKPFFSGKPYMSQADGSVFCDFWTGEGVFHRGAFAGNAVDLLFSAAQLDAALADQIDGWDEHALKAMSAWLSGNRTPISPPGS